MAAAADIPAQIAALQAQIAALQAQLPAQSEPSLGEISVDPTKWTHAGQGSFADEMRPVRYDESKWKAGDSMQQAVAAGLAPDQPDTAAALKRGDAATKAESDARGAAPKERSKDDAEALGYPLDDVLETAIGADSAVAAAAPAPAEAPDQPDTAAALKRGDEETKAELAASGAAPKERHTDDAEALGYPLSPDIEAAIGADQFPVTAPDQAVLEQLFLDAHNSPFDPASDLDAGKMVSIQELLASGQDFGDLANDEEARTRFALQLYRQ